MTGLAPALSHQSADPAAGGADLGVRDLVIQQ